MMESAPSCRGKLRSGFRRFDETATFLESAQIQWPRLPAAAFQTEPPRYVGRVDDRLDSDDR